VEISLDLVIKNFGREQKRGAITTTKFHAPCSQRNLLLRLIEHKPLFTRYVPTIVQRRKNRVPKEIIETVLWL